MTEHTLTLLPTGRQQSFPAGTCLSDALLEMDAVLHTPCGGKGTCGKCRVKVQGTERDVLACRTAICRDMTVHAGTAVNTGIAPLTGISPDGPLDAACDIGTTTVRISLADARYGRTFKLEPFLNPQRRYGHDVVSRIAAAADPAARAHQGRLIRSAVRNSLERVLKSSDIPRDRLRSLVFSGNTTMLYLLFGLDPAPLGRHPYQAPVRDFAAMPAADFTQAGIPSCVVKGLPVLSAFLGADLVGGLALWRDRGHDGNTFFIDLGTSGEIFLMNRHGEVFAASCAMGPALEGMSISCGMTAAEGAVTRVREEDGVLVPAMMGAGVPAGITGTALVDLLAILLDRGILSPSGAFTGEADSPSLPHPLRPYQDRGTRALMLWDSLTLTQRDIRQVQLAKAASLAASRLLLESAHLRPEEIDRVLIAGALGRHLHLPSFSRLGFIPDFPGAECEVLGSTSLMAAETACTDQGFLERSAVLRDRVCEVVLSSRQGFQKAFLQSMNFPDRQGR